MNANVVLGYWQLHLKHQLLIIYLLIDKLIPEIYDYQKENKEKK